MPSITLKKLRPHYDASHRAPRPPKARHLDTLDSLVSCCVSEYAAARALRVPNVGLGLWSVYGQGITEEVSEDIINLALESGINLFDLSEAPAIMDAYTNCRQFNCITPIVEQTEYHMFCREKVELHMPELYHKIGVDCSMSQLAIAWCLKNESVSCLLLGATSVEQLKENIHALQIVPQLTVDVMTEIERVLANKPQKPPMVSTLAMRNQQGNNNNNNNNGNTVRIDMARHLEKENVVNGPIVIVHKPDSVESDCTDQRKVRIQYAVPRLRELTRPNRKPESPPKKRVPPQAKTEVVRSARFSDCCGVGVLTLHPTSQINQ
ncbi:Voltage-gated potassium channel subunit beta-2, partial [Eumeta japonica]